MLKRIDAFLDRTTMYRLTLYCLAALWLSALALSFFRLLPYAPIAFIVSAATFIAFSWLANRLLAAAYKAPTNVESVYITALILGLIIAPPTPSHGIAFLSFAAWASVWAMASKYVLAVGRKHLFNPAAFAVALTAVTTGQSANWWIGTAIMAPVVIAAGALIVRKLRRFDVVASFLLAATAVIVGFGVLHGFDPLVTVRKAFFETPLFFFAFVMLTEPLTMPPTAILRTWYGTIVGFLFAPMVHVGPVWSTPELALLAGNLFSWIVSPKARLMLKLKAKELVAKDTYDFIFEPERPVSFRPGQYMEWTIWPDGADNRGNRRYFTIASSPTEKDVRMGVKFYPEPSSYKRILGGMKPGDAIIASQLAGDFVLPPDMDKKLAFMAGGIGITPFRSMFRWLIDRDERRPIVMLYSNKTPADLAYQDVIDEAERKLGIRTACIMTDTQGFIGAAMIAKEVPDYRERIFYLSGPHIMVVAFQKTLQEMGVHRSHIKRDFFPGFA